MCVHWEGIGKTLTHAYTIFWVVPHLSLVEALLFLSVMCMCLIKRVGLISLDPVWIQQVSGSVLIWAESRSSHTHWPVHFVEGQGSHTIVFSDTLSCKKGTIGQSQIRIYMSWNIYWSFTPPEFASIFLTNCEEHIGHEDFNCSLLFLLADNQLITWWVPLSNQMLFVTCAEYNRCRPYSEMLTDKPLTNRCSRPYSEMLTDKPLTNRCSRPYSEMLTDKP